MSVSIVIPAHRRAGTLADALASIAAQTHPVDEVVISEDGADDGVAEVIDRYRAAGLAIRHVRNEPPAGMRGNKRLAFMLARTELVGMLDDDDAYLPEFVARTVSALADHPECGFATTDQLVMDGDGQILEGASEEHARRFGRDRLATGVCDQVLELHLRSKAFPLQTTLFRRSVLEGTSFFTAGRGLMDFPLFLELGARGVSGYYLAEKLGLYRVHAESMTSQLGGEFGMTVIDDLRFTRTRLDVPEPQRALVGTTFRKTVLETAISFAHARRRREAFAALRQYGEFGWSVPSLRRLVVLVALLLGVPSRR